MTDWEYTGIIEEMSEADIKRRIEEAMAFEVAEKILPIPYVAGEEALVEYTYPELTAKCPMTGVRDFYTVTFKFLPGKLLPELKSLKKYLCGYDDLPISHEHLAAKIYKDFKQVVKPTKFHLILDTAVRGGIKTVVQLGDTL